MKTVSPPLILDWKGIHPLFELCRLQKFWAENGKVTGDKEVAQAAEELCLWLGPLLQKRAFHSLWSREDSYQSLASEVPCVDRPSLVYPEVGLHLRCSENFSAMTTLAGHHTSMGAVQAGSVEIRAFGPQAEPLNESKGFGIYRLPDGGAIERWTACAAYPEIWVEFQSEFKQNSHHFTLRFLGLGPERPLFFVFYVKAEQVQIGSEIFRPKALKRYRGEAKPALFGSQLVIETDASCQMELIPLAGEGCFWDCEFLLAFSLPPCENRISFESRSP